MDTNSNLHNNIYDSVNLTRLQYKIYYSVDNDWFKLDKIKCH